MPFAVSWRGQRAGNRDYCGQNKEQPRKDTIAIPPYLPGSSLELPAGFNPFSPVPASLPLGELPG